MPYLEISSLWSDLWPHLSGQTKVPLAYKGLLVLLPLTYHHNIQRSATGIADHILPLGNCFFSSEISVHDCSGCNNTGPVGVGFVPILCFWISCLCHCTIYQWSCPCVGLLVGRANVLIAQTADSNICLHSCNHVHFYLFLHSFLHSFIPSFIHSFICSFICNYLSRKRVLIFGSHWVTFHFCCLDWFHMISLYAMQLI